MKAYGHLLLKSMFRNTLLAISTLLLICSCTGKKVEITRQASISAEQAGAKTQSIRASQDKIDKVVEKAISEKDVTVLPAVKPLTDQTRSDSVIIDSMVFDLVDMLKNKDLEIAELKKLRKKDLEKIKELEDKNSFKHKLPWILGGLGLIVVGLGLFLGRHKITVLGIAIGGSSFGVITYYEWLEKILPLMLIICIGFIVGVINYERQERALKKNTKEV